MCVCVFNVINLRKVEWWMMKFQYQSITLHTEQLCVSFLYFTVLQRWFGQRGEVLRNRGRNLKRQWEIPNLTAGPRYFLGISHLGSLLPWLGRANIESHLQILKLFFQSAEHRASQQDSISQAPWWPED